ncbi:hypothetical protein NSK11_contig00317-0001 [Nocardia seriolae]|uniref:Uncharacterized protein n=1 Tax=Nocardia seriolae TaxID=37332 RepID=A0ABC9Z6M3_9NOCA|nr:hypothetical protein NSER024013_17700 [Nocardia seriolae]GAP33527.1 hypothetical protein NSK11_contig00317-0001 [Nocardia seriolae]
MTAVPRPVSDTAGSATGRSTSEQADIVPRPADPRHGSILELPPALYDRPQQRNNKHRSTMRSRTVAAEPPDSTAVRRFRASQTCRLRAGSGKDLGRINRVLADGDVCG